MSEKRGFFQKICRAPLPCMFGKRKGIEPGWRELKGGMLEKKNHLDGPPQVVPAAVKPRGG